MSRAATGIGVGQNAINKVDPPVGTWGVDSGLGVATGDATYAAVAAFGVAVVTNVLISQRSWVGLAGGLVIAVIGLRTIFSSRQAGRPGPPPRREGNRLTGNYFSVLALTLSNPPTVVSFTALFAGLGLRVGSGSGPAVALALGVMLGSALWWVLLTIVISVLGERLTPAITRGSGVVSGIALVVSGILISLPSLGL